MLRGDSVIELIIEHTQKKTNDHKAPLSIFYTIDTNSFEVCILGIHLTVLFFFFEKA